MITSPIHTNARRAVTAALAGLALIAAAGSVSAQQAQPQAPAQFGPRAGQQEGGAAQPQQPKAEIVATHGNWQIQCGDFAGPRPAQPQAQAGEGGETAASGGKSDAATATDGAAAPSTLRQCGMIQSARNAERQNIGMTLVLVKQPQGDKTITMMRILVPIGVYLPTGVALEIDGAAVGRVPFTQCIPQLCMAFAEATPETLEKMKKGTSANFIIYEGPGAGVGIEVSLKGFTAGLAELDKQSS